MKIIKGDLILTEDTTFRESIKVEGNIGGYFNLKVIGNIDARNIEAWDIVCETRTKKGKNAKTECRIYIKNKSKIRKKEQEDLKEKK